MFFLLIVRCELILFSVKYCQTFARPEGQGGLVSLGPLDLSGSSSNFPLSHPCQNTILMCVQKIYTNISASYMKSFCEVDGSAKQGAD